MPDLAQDLLRELVYQPLFSTELHGRKFPLVPPATGLRPSCGSGKDHEDDFMYFFSKSRILRTRAACRSSPVPVSRKVFTISCIRAVSLRRAPIVRTFAKLCSLLLRAVAAS